jgi:hypothetical protein
MTSSTQRHVEEGIAANSRPVDIPIGVVAPLLYQIGEERRYGAITVDHEHEFTASGSVPCLDLTVEGATQSSPSADALICIKRLG